MAPTEPGRSALAPRSHGRLHEQGKLATATRTGTRHPTRLRKGGALSMSFLTTGAMRACGVLSRICCAILASFLQNAAGGWGLTSFANTKALSRLLVRKKLSFTKAPRFPDGLISARERLSLVETILIRSVGQGLS